MGIKDKPIIRIIDMERTLERKSLNGFTYQFAEWMLMGRTIVSTYYKMEKDTKFSHSTKTFNTLEEANAWVDGLDAAALAPKPEYKPVEIPADYYGVRGRYYGD